MDRGERADPLLQHAEHLFLRPVGPGGLFDKRHDIGEGVFHPVLQFAHHMPGKHVMLFGRGGIVHQHAHPPHFTIAQHRIPIDIINMRAGALLVDKARHPVMTNGLAGLQHLIDRRVSLAGKAGHDVRRRLADMIFHGNAVQLGQRGVDPDMAVLVIELRQTDRAELIEGIKLGARLRQLAAQRAQLLIALGQLFAQPCGLIGKIGRTGLFACLGLVAAHMPRSLRLSIELIGLYIQYARPRFKGPSAPVISGAYHRCVTRLFMRWPDSGTAGHSGAPCSASGPRNASCRCQFRPDVGYLMFIACRSRAGTQRSGEFCGAGTDICGRRSTGDQSPEKGQGLVLFRC